MHAPDTTARRCLVIGGGLAGISAACALAERGMQVTLLEQRPYLGGRAFSFPDPETGVHIDNGQHVFLGCCTAYIDLLRRLGVLGQTALQPRMRAVVIGRDGRRGVLREAPLLPSPLHLLPSFLAYPHLSLPDKLAAAALMRRIPAISAAEASATLEDITFREWLTANGQSPGAIAALWDLLTLPVFNDTADAISAAMGIMFFREGLLAGRGSAAIGHARVGLTQLVDESARVYLRDRGGAVETPAAVDAIAIEGGAVRGVVAGGALRPADAVVAAVPWDALPRLLPPEVAHTPHFAAAAGLQWAPIVNAHLWYDRPVVDEPFAAALDSPLQWVFSRTRLLGLPGPGQWIDVSMSGAWEEAAMEQKALQDRLVAEMARVFPAAAQAQVQRFRVVRQVAATFRCTPGAQALRPAQRTPIGGLALAGDWTQTGWPATMESAVRSGVLAADALAPPTAPPRR